MNNLFARLRLVIWTSVLAVVLAVTAILVEIANPDGEIANAIGVTALVLAILSPRGGD